MKKFLTNISVFLLVNLIILTLYGLLADRFFTKEKYLPNSSKRYWVMKQQGHSFDYAVLGSSRAELAFDMLLLDSSINLNGINIGSNGSGYVDNYLVLNKFLENKNKITYLFLQTDIYSLDPTSFSNAFHVYNFLPYWNDSIYKKAISHYLDATDNWLFSNLPLVRYYKYNKYYSPFQIIQRMSQTSTRFIRIDQKIKSANFKPENFNEVAVRKKFNSRKPKRLVIDSFDLSYLIRIFELANKHNIKVFCFSSPDFYTQTNKILNYDSVKVYLNNIITEKRIPYLTCPDSVRNNIFLFNDPLHLNDYGRLINTKSFALFFNQKRKIDFRNNN